MTEQAIKGLVTGGWDEQRILDEFAAGWADDVLYDDINKLATGDAANAKACEITFTVKMLGEY